MTNRFGRTGGRIPHPDTTPEGPAYEGRPLPRPQDEVVDQGVAFDVDTVMTRRRALGMIGLGAGSLALAACTTEPRGVSSSAPPETSPAGSGTPAEIAGPFPGDGSNGVDVLERSGIVRGDIRSSIGGGETAAGVALNLTLTLLGGSGVARPLSGAAVYVWQCDAAGGYSLYSPGLENATYLRGVQEVNDSGEVTFATVFPGCYPGRWPHVHFEVYPDVDSVRGNSRPLLTSQLAFPEDISREIYGLADYAGSARNLDDVTLGSDMVFSDDSAAHQMAAVTREDGGFRAALTVRLDP